MPSSLGCPGPHRAHAEVHRLASPSIIARTHPHSRKSPAPRSARWRSPAASDGLLLGLEAPAGAATGGGGPAAGMRRDKRRPSSPTRAARSSECQCEWGVTAQTLGSLRFAPMSVPRRRRLPPPTAACACRHCRPRPPRPAASSSASACWSGCRWWCRRSRSGSGNTWSGRRCVALLLLVWAACPCLGYLFSAVPTLHALHPTAAQPCLDCLATGHPRAVLQAAAQGVHRPQGQRAAGGRRGVAVSAPGEQPCSAQRVVIQLFSPLSLSPRWPVREPQLPVCLGAWLCPGTAAPTMPTLPAVATLAAGTSQRLGSQTPIVPTTAARSSGG